MVQADLVNLTYFPSLIKGHAGHCFPHRIKHFDATFWWDIFMRHFDKTFLWDIFIRHIDDLWTTLMTSNDLLYGDDVNGMALWQFWLSLVNHNSDLKDYFFLLLSIYIKKRSINPADRRHWMSLRVLIVATILKK